jgi:hypothetical protein
MNCSLTAVILWILGAAASLGLAMGLAYSLNILALVGAIALVTTVAFLMLPQLRSALNAYATCRGSIADCSIIPAINVLGQIGVIGALVFYTLALGFEFAAIAAFLTIILGWLGGILTLTAAGMVAAGNIASGLAILLLLLGVLTDALVFKNCCDSHSGA